MKTFTYLTLLASFNALAETDNFNMSLNGDFTKDYCTIDTRIFYNPDSVATNNTEMGGIATELTVQMVSGDLYCSDGTYNITFTSNLPSDFSIPLKNQSFELQLDSYYGNIDGIFGQDTPITLNNFSFPFSRLDFDIWLKLKPTNGDWNDTDTRYNHTVSPIITIEKL